LADAGADALTDMAARATASRSPDMGAAQPQVIRPGGGEPITDSSRRIVRVLLEHELIAVTWSRFGSGEREPVRRTSQERAEAWFVLSGELTFEFGADRAKQSVAAGTFVLAPQNTSYSFANATPAGTTFLSVHAPGGRPGAALRSEDASSDASGPPADSDRAASAVLVRGPGEGNPVAVGPVEILAKATAADSDGTFFAAVSVLPPPTTGIPPHFHKRYLETLFVLEGTLTLQLGDHEVDAAAGSYAAIPPGNIHTFTNRTSEPVRVLFLHAPGGFELLLQQIAAGAPREVLARYDLHLP
jgi:mannose-6-phosphate isomerase-like protein (cupin superfamily)